MSPVVIAYHAARSQVPGRLQDKQIRSLQVFDGIPHRNDVNGSTKVYRKIVTLASIDAALNCILHRIRRDIDAFG